MTILIVDALAANEGRRKFSRDAIGVGPRLLAGICEKNNRVAKIVRVEDLLDKEHFLDRINSKIFLISAMSVDKIAVQRVIIRIKKNISKPIIILGGPIVAEQTILREIDISAGIVGEGEYILDGLLRNDFSFENLGTVLDERINIDKIKNSLIIQNRKLSTESIFEEFPPSTNKITDYPDYWFSKVYVEITRGCSNHFRGDIVKKQGGCSDCGNCNDPDDVFRADCPEDIPPGCGFCSVPATFGPPRSKSQALVVKEIKELFRKGVRRIILSSPGFFDYFRGENSKTLYSPTKPLPNLKKISELLTELAHIRDEQSELCSISIENVKPSLVSESGARIIGKTLPETAISIGCETFDVNHSTAIGRPSSSNQALEAARMFKEVGIAPQIYLIHSLPGETTETLRTTRKVVNGKLKDFAEKITVYKYLPLPNSPFTVTGSSAPADRKLLSEIRKRLIQDIIDFNKKKKEELIGDKLYLIVAEKDLQHKNYYFSYPIYSGPAVTIYSENNILGKTVLAEITRAITDRLVEAKIIKE